MEETKTTVENENIASYVYWSIFSLTTLICVIIFTSFMGLFHAGCPRPMADEPCTKCSRAQGSRWLLASNSMTFIGYWLFVLVVMVTFAAGGFLYTEVCRSVVYYEDPDSASTLNVFDKLLNESLDVSIDLLVFDSYTTCAANESLYNAFKVGVQYVVSFIILSTTFCTPWSYQLLP
jgi:hypothetical protein